jgi:hypothetical protein
LLPLSRLLAIDLTSQERCFPRIGVDDQTSAKLIDKPLSPGLTLVRSCAINTMHEFGKAHRGKSSFLIGSNLDDFTYELGWRLSAPFGSDHHA